MSKPAKPGKSPSPKAKQRAKGASSNGNGLNPKQQAFVNEFLVDLNATQAAIRAGYSEKTARVIAAENLTKPNIAAAIEAAMAERAKRTEVTEAQILAELKCLAFSDIGEIMDFTGESIKVKDAKDIPEAARRALASLKVKRYLEGHGENAKEVEMLEFKLVDKLQALIKYGQHLGMFVKKVEHSGKDGEPIPIQIVEIVRPAAAPKEEKACPPASTK